MLTSRPSPQQLNPVNGKHLRLTDIEKRFGGRLVLRGISVSIAAGEVFTMLGPSGAGKSTILKCIVGLEQPDRGSVHLDGRNITDVAPSERGIGLVFQNHRLFPSMTVRQNVAFPLEARMAGSALAWIRNSMRPLRASEIAKKVDAALDAVHVRPHANKLPHELSGGEAQRVALARAMVSEPGVVCLDEPLSSLDKSLRQQMQDEIRAIQKASGRTMIFVTHDQAEALAISHRVAILSDGRIEQVGTPRELYERPTSVFVATFLGECNIVDHSTCGSLNAPWLGEMLHRAAGHATTTVIGIRPEHLQLTDAPTATTFATGVVVSTTFMGSQTRAVVEVGPGIRLIVLTQAGSLSSGVRPHARVYVSCSRESVLYLTDGRETIPPVIDAFASRGE